MLRSRNLVLITVVLIGVCGYTDNRANVHTWGTFSYNTHTAIDTFYNTQYLTNSHFKKVLFNKSASKICTQLAKFNNNGGSISLDSIEIIGARIIILENNGLILYHDSLSTSSLPGAAVKFLAESPTGTRVLVDKIQVYRHYDNGVKDAHIVHLAPIFYELVE